MQFSKDTKRFFLLLSAFTVALALCAMHFPEIGGWILASLGAFSPFLVGGVMAFILSIPMRLFNGLLGRPNKKGQPLVADGKRKPLSLVLSIVLVFFLLGIFSVIVVPQLLDTITGLMGAIVQFVPVAQQGLTDMMTWLEEYPGIHDAVAPMIPDMNQLAVSLIGIVQRYAGTVVPSIMANISAIFGSVTDVIISFVFAIYVLLQTESLSRQCKKLIYAFLPKPFCDSVVGIARMAHQTFSSYVTIQCTEAAILGGLCLIGMLIFRFPHALVISVIMLICALIPIYGAIISCVIGALLVLIESPVKAIGFVVFILVLQQIETNLIYPRVVSTAINLPSMWVLLAVTVGGGIFGIVGMLTAVPIVSITYTLLGSFTNHRLLERNLSTVDPAPREENAQ